MDRNSSYDFRSVSDLVSALNLLVLLQGGVCRGDDAAFCSLTDTQTVMVILQVGQTQHDVSGFDDVITVKRGGQQTIIGIDVFPLDFPVAERQKVLFP